MDPHNSPRFSLVLQESESYKLAQALYNAVTGKTEKLSKAFSADFKIRKADLDQLHRKLTQTTTQWKVLERNDNIVVHHVDDNNETFSSFDRFQYYDSSKTCAVEGVTFEFNFLILPQNIEIPQPYKLTVRALSTIAAHSKLSDVPFSGTMMRFFSRGPIVTEIEYVDYVIARSILSCVESWVNEIATAKDSKFLSGCQRYSHWIPHFCVTLLVGWALTLAYLKAPQIIGLTFPPVKGVQYLIAALGVAWFSKYIAQISARFLERKIDSMIPLSYILLNKGDEKLIEGRTKSKKFCILGIVGGALFLVVQGAATQYFVDVVLKWLFGAIP